MFKSTVNDRFRSDPQEAIRKYNDQAKARQAELRKKY